MRCRILPLLLVALTTCSEGGGGLVGGGGEEDPPPGPAPFGLTQRVPVSGLAFPTTTPQTGTYSAVRAFTNVSFSQPIAITHAPGDRTRLFVAEQRGTIQVFANDPATPTKKTFLDIQGRVDDGGEMGLLGLAFDPDYETNGYFYVNYTSNSGGRHTVVSRFAVTSDPDVADAASETILLQFNQPQSNHNGGWIGFGPDEHLYIATGDGGGGGDPDENGQDLTNLLGKILRITRTGGIPSDNPFVGQGGGVRGEIWAYGLRNPWRAGFDRDTGDLWCGDVGQGSREEISLIVKGGNYGWDVFEGNLNHENPTGIDIDTTERPIIDWGRSLGNVAVGGHVYRGGDLPSLRGKYLYADYGSGRVWALEYDGTTVQSNTQIVQMYSPVSFGEDADGEIFIVSHGGIIHRLEETSGGPSGPFPAKLSDTGLFTDVAALTPAAGLIEYDVNSPLWSDGAAKRRWIALPGTTKIGFDPTGAWDFPEGTVLVKHFELDTVGGTVRLETRVLVLEDTGWHGYTYRWNVAQTDADLLSGAETSTYNVPDASAPGGVRAQTWYFPSRTDCLSCHTQAAGRILGVRTRQLNGAFAYPAATDNQLRSWNHIGLFTTDIGDHAQYDALPDPADAAAPLASRARSYLDVNCAICHQPGGPPTTAIDLRYGVALGSLNIVDVVPTRGDLGLTDARIAASGSKERSVLWERMRRLDGNRMPVLASSVVDPLGTGVVGDWIDAGPQ